MGVGFRTRVWGELLTAEVNRVLKLGGRYWTG
jgi:hypothetical protein